MITNPLFPSILVLALHLPAAPLPSSSMPLPQAHSHNDYEQDRPLLGALSQGFCSVEADVHLVDGKLLVAHDPEEVDAARTLEQLYLKPLSEIVRTNGGKVYPNGGEFILLIDIKTDAATTYSALRHLLQSYKPTLTHFVDGQIQTNAVTVILSGNRPAEMLRREDDRLAAYDGRLTDLEKDLPAFFAPLISDNWQQHFTWKGEGDFSPTEKLKLQTIVDRAHQQGKKIRFWAVPDNEPAWEILAAAGVDLINTDRLVELAEFLRERH